MNNVYLNPQSFLSQVYGIVYLPMSRRQKSLNVPIPRCAASFEVKDFLGFIGPILYIVYKECQIRY